MKKILVLVASQTNFPFIKAAKELGDYVITCDNNPDNIGHKSADENIFVDVNDFEAILEQVNDKNIDLVTGFVSAHGLRTASLISEALGLSDYSLHSLETLMNKGRFRDFLKDNNFSCPAFQYATSAAEIKWADIVFPAIMKPTDSGGSLGVNVVRSKEEVLSHFSFAQHHSPAGEVIIEQYLENGKLINGDCLVADGSIVGHIMGEYIFDPEISSVLPIATVFPTTENIGGLKNELERICDLLKFPNGIFNFEAMMKDGKCYIIEINPRPSGNYLWKLMGYKYETDIIKDLIQLTLKKKDSKVMKQRNDYKYAYQIFYTGEKKRYKKLELKDDLKHILKEIIEFKHPGEMLEPFRSLYDRVAIALIEMKNREEEVLYHNSIKEFKL